MSEENGKTIPETTKIPNVISLAEWKQKEEAETVLPQRPKFAPKARKPKPLNEKNISQLEQAKRASMASSYILEMYSDLIKLSCAALGDIQIVGNQQSAKIARTTLATISKVVNQVAIDLQTQSDEDPITPKTDPKP